MFLSFVRTFRAEPAPHVVDIGMYEVSFDTSNSPSSVSDPNMFVLTFSINIWEFAGEYHCWLQMNTTLMIGQFVPIVILAILTLTLIEAAGAAEYRLIGSRKDQRFILVYAESYLVLIRDSRLQQRLCKDPTLSSCPWYSAASPQVPWLPMSKTLDCMGHSRSLMDSLEEVSSFSIALETKGWVFDGKKYSRLS